VKSKTSLVHSKSALDI